MRHTSKTWRTRGAVIASAAAALAGGSLPATAAGGPSLGAARSFAVLGGSTVTSTGLTAVVGDVGVSPGSSIVGFPPATVAGGAIHANDATAARAHADASLAYAFLAGMPSIPANNRTGVDLGGKTLAPGVYKFNTSAQLTGALTLDAQGDSGALFVFQVGTTLTSASNASVVVINGGANYDKSNVFWQVGSSATLGSGTAFTGNILAYSSITVVSGSSMIGDALALHGAVTMDRNAITSPPASPSPTAALGSPAVPTNLTAVPIAGSPSTGTSLSWTDASSSETSFRVYRMDGAGPGFVLVGSIATADMAGTGGVMNFQNLGLDVGTTHTYRVTAFSSTTGESVPSNEIRLDPAVILPVPSRWLDVRLGRARSMINDQNRARTDRVFVTGSYSVVDVTVPPASPDADPRVDGITIQVGAPGDLVLITIPANDPRWGRHPKKGVYVWKSHDGRSAPVSIFRIDTRKSEFTLTSNRIEFGAMPVNSITVSLTYQGATGSDIRFWSQPSKMPRGARARFSLSK